MDSDAFRETLTLATESLKAVESIQYTSSSFLPQRLFSLPNTTLLCADPKRATTLILSAVSSLTALALAPSTYPLLSLNQALFPLLLSLPPNFIPSSMTISTRINSGLASLLLFPHPTKAIALASTAKLRVALLHPADEEAFWKDLEAVKDCLEELRTSAKEVEKSFGDRKSVV